MTEGQDAAEAEQEVHRHCRQREHQYARAKAGVAADERHPIRHREQQDPDENGTEPGFEGFHCTRPESPNNPCGRTISTTAIIT